MSKGTPRKPPTSKNKCRQCNGTGTVPADHRDRRKGQKTCLHCGGNGEL